MVVKMSEVEEMATALGENILQNARLVIYKSEREFSSDFEYNYKSIARQ